MYVLRTRTTPELEGYATSTLMEMTPARLRTAEKVSAAYDSFNKHTTHYRVLHWQQAHAWVLKGGHHETTLWVDEGRVRRAG